MHYIKRALWFVAANAAVIIALSSLFVAGLSLYFAIEAQRIDLAYKELSIRPILSIEANVSDFDIQLRNAGYGHAVISRVVFGLDGRCFDSDIDDNASYDLAYEKFQAWMLSDVFGSSFSQETKKPINADALITVRPIDRGAVIRAGETFRMFYLEPGTLKVLNTMEPEPLTKARNAFSLAVSQLPFRLDYCSATGEFCGYIDTNNNYCQ